MTPLKICPQCGTEYPASARFCEVDGTTLRSASGDTELVGSIVADRYHILKKLGEGGMGQVYLAEHVKMGRKSALKVMHPGMVKDVDAISRFNREAANASRISHPNVAAVYDFGETPEGIIYLAMEFVDGAPLTSVIEQAGSLPAKRAAEIVRQTAEALAVAHDMGIVHRDLKPDNIMIAKTRDGGDLVKVVDFGIAKATGSDAQKVTKTGLAVGTPEYMSPEQLAGDKLDGRSDIYSLGLVAFNMFTGNLPFPSESAQESMIMRLTDRPTPLSETRPDVTWPADVQAVMDRALERDTALRYQTASEFGRDLYQAVDRMPETPVRQVGTQVAGVPATRVSTPRPPSSSGNGSGSATRAATPSTRTETVQRKRSLVPVIGGGAAILVVALLVMSMLRKGGATPADTTTTPTRQNGTLAASPNPIDSTKPSVPPAPGNAGKASSLEQQITDLIDDSKVPGKGQAVLAKVGKLQSQVRTNHEQYLTAAVRANVFATRGTGEDTTKACSEIKKVMSSSLSQQDADQANGRLLTLSCPD